MCLARSQGTRSTGIHSNITIIQEKKKEMLSCKSKKIYVGLAC